MKRTVISKFKVYAVFGFTVTVLFQQLRGLFSHSKMAGAHIVYVHSSPADAETECLGVVPPPLLHMHTSAQARFLPFLTYFHFSVIKSIISLIPLVTYSHSNDVSIYHRWLFDEIHCHHPCHCGNDWQNPKVRPLVHNSLPFIHVLDYWSSSSSPTQFL